MSDFYTYEYLRSRDWTPYYVGKGRNGRAFSNHHRIKPPKDSTRIRIQYWADEAEAFAMEKWYIKFWGRKDIGTGILRNMTDGGDGRSNPSAETRRKLSAGAREKGRKGGFAVQAMHKKNGTGFYSREMQIKGAQALSIEDKRKNGRIAARKCKENGTGIFSPNYDRSTSQKDYLKQHPVECSRRVDALQRGTRVAKLSGRQPLLPYPLIWKERYLGITA